MKIFRKNMNPAMPALVLFLVFTASPAGPLHADVALPDIISDGMVLQRDVTTPMWGKASVGALIFGPLSTVRTLNYYQV